MYPFCYITIKYNTNTDVDECLNLLEKLRRLSQIMIHQMLIFLTNYQITLKPWLDNNAFPEAKIIHADRDPIATCFSIYKTYFSEGLSWAFDMDSIVDFTMNIRIG